MVQMVSIGHIQYMKSWKYDVDGRVPEEWDLPEEPALPPIDSWARKVIPIKIASSTESDLYTEAEQVSNLNGQKEVSKRPTSMSSAKIQEDRLDSSTRTKQQGPERRPIEGTLFPHSGSKGGMRTHQVKSCKMTRSNVDGKNKKRNNSETRSASQQDLPRQETEVCLPKSALSYHYPSTMGTHVDAGMKTSQAVEANGITAVKEKIAGKEKVLVSMDLHSSRAQRPSAKAHSTGSLSRGRAGG